MEMVSSFEAQMFSNQSEIPFLIEANLGRKFSPEVTGSTIWYLWAILWICAFVVKCYPKPNCSCTTKLSGKVVVITGGTDGVGKETALELARRGAKIVIPCRNLRKGEAVVQEILKRTGNRDITIIHADFEKLDTVKLCTDKIRESFAQIDILINNAGIGHGVGYTHDGFPKVLGVNHLGPFLLTTELLDLLRRSPSPRVIFVSSIAHLWGQIDFESLHKPDARWVWSQFHAYARSKLANVLFARELHRREGTIRTFAAHPGWTFTSMFREFPLFVKLVAFPLFHLFLYRPKVGAQTQIHLALAPHLDGLSGKYFVSCQPSKTSSRALDCQLAENLWSYSEQTVSPFLSNGHQS